MRNGGERIGRGRRAPLSSAFAGRLNGYVEYKRELGYKATVDQERFLPAFDRFCRERFPEKASLDKELVQAWSRSSESAHTRASRSRFIRRFAAYLVEEGEEAYVLSSKSVPRQPPAEAPHLFTQEELDAFFGAADAMEASYMTKARHLVAPVFFRVLYCCGLRPKEARDLRVEDFDLKRGIIHVVGSKDRRDRDVPVHEDVRALCEAYSAKVEEVYPGREWFFPGQQGRHWSDQAMLHCFRRCWENAGVAEFSGPAPVPYSFRHTFATNVVVRWRSEGVDVGSNLRFLQEFMGHKNVNSTLYYVHLARGGLGDATAVSTWSPADRTKEGYYYVED